MKPTLNVALLGLLISAAPCLGQNSAPPTPVSTPAPVMEATATAGANALPPGQPIALKEVVERTLAQNLDIQIISLDRSVAREEVTKQYGIYDPVFVAGARMTRTDEQNISKKAYTVPTGETPKTKTPKPTPTAPLYAQNGGDGKNTSGDQKGAILVNDGLTYQDNSAVNLGLEQRTPLGSIITLQFKDERQNIHDLREANARDPSYYESASIGITQPLLKNFGPLVNNAQIRIAKRQKEKSQETFRGEVTARLAEVMKAYWDLAFTIRNREVKMASLDAARELERVNTIKFKAGTLPQVDVYQAQAEVATREESVIVAESQIRAAQDNLHRLMNWYDKGQSTSWDAWLSPTDKPTPGGKMQLDELQLVSEAVQMRPDYREALADRDVAEINRKVSKWQRLPELNAFGTYGHNGRHDNRDGAWDKMRGGDYTDYTVGVEFRYPLLNRAARAAYHQAMDQKKQSELSIQRLELQIVTDVRQAIRDVQTALKRIDSTTQSVAANQEKVNAERKRLEVGQSTTFSVLTFETDLADAQTQQLSAYVDHEKALIDLEKSRGTLLASQGIVLDTHPELVTRK